MGTQHGNAARKFSREMQQGHAAWNTDVHAVCTRCTDMQHAHAKWRSGMDAAWTCGLEMHLVMQPRYSSRIYGIDEHPALTCSMEILCGHAAGQCNMDVQRRRVART